MRHDSDPLPRRTLGEGQGKQAIKRLAMDALAALADVALVDQIDALQDRVFSRSSAELFQRDPYDDSWRFKPMVELLLYEVRDVATAPTLEPAERRARVAWALTMAGF